MRTLRLLEQHHQKLAELIKAGREDAQTLVSTNSSTGAVSATSAPLNNAPVPEPRTIDTSPRHISHHSQSALAAQHRELSSSIASNLASARGIPTNRSRRGNQSPAQSSPQNAEGRLLRPARKSNLGEHEGRLPSQDEKAQATASRPKATSSIATHSTSPDQNSSSPRHPASTAIPETVATTADDPFSRFYSTFGNLISTLSAPLAFAGLPLGSEAPTKSPGSSQNKSASPSASRVAADPDLARFFSRAALQAVRDEHGAFGGAESFYVVPTTGGTMSYAGMLSNAHQGSNVTEEDEAEFVDASETPQPTSPRLPRQREPRPGSGGRRQGAKGGKTWEELAVANETLKAVVLDLGDRLRAFELGAQRSSRALHASVRGLSSPTGSVTGGSGVPPLPGAEGMKVLQEKLKESEEEMKGLKKENKRLGRENQKLIGVIERYRERWEMLKVNARERVKGETSGPRASGESEE